MHKIILPTRLVLPHIIMVLLVLAKFKFGDLKPYCIGVRALSLIYEFLKILPKFPLYDNYNSS